VEENGEQKARLFYLEGLRGLAALVVVLNHFSNTFFPAASYVPALQTHAWWEPLLHNTPLGFFLAGNFSVCLFFIMSAFVLTRPFFLKRDRSVIVKAATKRYFRLLPPVAVSVIVALALLKLQWFTNQAAAAATGSVWLHGLFATPGVIREALYQAFVGSLITGDVSYNPLLWTMTYEFLGSMLIFATAALVGRRRWRWIAYAALGVLFIHSFYLGFIIGMVLADLAANSKSFKAWTRSLSRTFAAALVLSGLLLAAYPSDGYPGASLYHAFVLPGFDAVALMAFWHTLAATLLILGVFAWVRAQNALGHPWLVQLGKMSFSMYVIHLIFICTVTTWLFSRLTPLGYLWAAGLACLASLFFILGLSYAYTRLFDAPAIRAANKFGSWFMTEATLRPRLPLSLPRPTRTKLGHEGK
jgi:peptidoglycan/LPS O-acetylase OafA/YrhL